MHAARCFLAALAGYRGSGWVAAEEYTATVLPAEVSGWVVIVVVGMMCNIAEQFCREQNEPWGHVTVAYYRVPVVWLVYLKPVVLAKD